MAKKPKPQTREQKRASTRMTSRAGKASIKGMDAGAKAVAAAARKQAKLSKTTKAMPKGASADLRADFAQMKAKAAARRKQKP